MEIRFMVNMLPSLQKRRVLRILTGNSPKSWFVVLRLASTIEDDRHGGKGRRRQYSYITIWPHRSSLRLEHTVRVNLDDMASITGPSRYPVSSLVLLAAAYSIRSFYTTVCMLSVSLLPRYPNWLVLFCAFEAFTEV